MPTLSQDDVSIRIQTTANNEGISSAKAGLNELDSATTRVKESSKLAGVATQAFSFAAGIAMADIGSKVSGFVKDSVTAYNDFTAIQAQVVQVLNTTGKSTSISATYVDQLAKSMSGYSGQTKTAILQGQTILLQFSQISRENLPEMTKAMVDLSQRMGVDNVTAAKQLGIALDNPTTGMSRLRRSGIDFTAAQTEAIKAMQKSGDVAGADALLMKGLEEKVGGAAGAFGNTFPGEIAKAKAALEEFRINAVGKVKDDLNNINWSRYITDLDNFGHSVLGVFDKIWNYLKPSLEALWNTLTDKLLPALGNFWHNIIEPLIPVIGGALVGAFKLALDALNLLWAILVPVINFMADHKWVVEVLAGAFVALKASMALGDAITAVQGGFQVLTLTTLPQLDLALSTVAASFIAAVPVAAVLLALAAITNAAVNTFNTLHNTDNAIKGLQQSQNSVIPELENAAVLGATAAQRNSAIKTLHNMGVKGYASGGNVSAGVPILVGEEGQELFVPNQSGRIVSNNQTNQMMNNKTVSIGQVVIQNASAAQEFWKGLDQDTLLVSKGLTPNRSMG